MPKDFFLNARYLFGFLAPGSMWIACVMLALNKDVAQIVQSMTVAQGWSSLRPVS